MLISLEPSRNEKICSDIIHYGTFLYLFLNVLFFYLWSIFEKKLPMAGSYIQIIHVSTNSSPIPFVQIIYHQVDQMHDWSNFILTASKIELSYFLHMIM